MAVRTGFSTFLNVAHRLCLLFARFGGSISVAIEASNASQADKDKLHAAMAAIAAACAVVDLIRPNFE